MTTILKKSSNDAESPFKVMRHPKGVILSTPIRLVNIPEDALLSGVAVIGASLSYLPLAGANAVQVDLGSHEDAKAALSAIGEAIAHASDALNQPAQRDQALRKSDEIASCPDCLPDTRVQTPSGAPILPRTRLMTWLRGKGCWPRRLVFMGLAAFSFWLFYPDASSDESQVIGFNPPAEAISGSSPTVAMNVPSSPYANDPLAIGLNPPEMGASASSSTTAPASDNAPYVFKPNLVRPQVEMPELKCD